MQLLYKFIYRSSFAILLSCLCLSDTVTANVTPSSLLAQKPPSNQKPQEPEAKVQVAEVVVQGADGKLSDLVKQTAKIKPGGITTRSGLQEDINAIFATGYFSNVKVVPEDVPKGVRVTFVVVTNPVLRRVELNSGTLVPEKVVNEIFSQHYGSILNFATLQAGVNKLNKWYQDNGYVLAQILGQPNVSKDGVVKLQVAEGIIEDIQIKFLDQKGEEIKSKTPPDTILKQVTLSKRGQVFNRTQVEKDLRNIYKLGKFSDVNIKLNPGQDPQKVVLVFNVVETSVAQGTELLQLQEELEAAQANKNRIEEAKILRKQGHFYQSSKETYQKAIEKYQAALKIFQAEKDIIGAAQVYNNIGNVYYEQKKNDEAINNYQNALKNYQSQKNKLGEAIVSNNLGNTYVQHQKYDQAASSYERSRQVFAVLNEPFWSAISLSNLAFSYYYSSEQNKAIESYNQAITAWKKLKQPANPDQTSETTKSSEKTAKFNLGFGASSLKGTYFLATVQLDDKLTNKISDKRFWFTGTLFNSANAFQLSGDYQQAIYSYNDALEMWKAISRDKVIASIIEDNDIERWLNLFIDNFGKLVLAQLYNDLGQKQLSSQYRQQIIDIIKKEAPAAIASLTKDNDNPGLKSVLMGFTPIFMNLFNQEQTDTEYSEKFLQDFMKPLLEFVKQLLNQNQTEYKNIEVIAQPFIKYYNVISNVTIAEKLEKANDNSKKQQAIGLYQQNLAILKDVKDEDLCFDKFLKAIDTEKKLQQQLKSENFQFCFLSAKAQQAKTLNAIAKVQIDLKQNQQAVDTLKQALVLVQTNSTSPSENQKINEQKTQEILNQIIAASKNANNSDLTKFNSIIAYLNQAFDESKVKDAKRTTAETLSLFGQAYAAKQEYQNALGFYSSSLLIWQSLDDVIKQADTRLAMANVERTRGNLTSAKTQIEKAIEAIESERAQTSNQEQKNNSNNNDDDDKDTFPEVQAKSSTYKSYLTLAKYLESKQSYYDFYIDLLMQLHNQQPKAGYDVLAFQASEHSKSRSLRAILKKGFNQNPSKTTESKADTNYVQLAKVPQLSEIQQQLLDDNTLLLEYTLGEERSYLWAVTKNSIQTYQLPKRSEIDTLSRQFIESLKSPSSTLATRGIGVKPNTDTTTLPRIGNQLSKMLLAPVADKLGNKRLLVVSDGALQYVPFAALSIPSFGSKGTQSGEDYKPLLVNHEIVGLPSASLQVLLQRDRSKKQRPSKTLAMLADPIFSRSDERVMKNISTSASGNTISTTPLFQRLPGTRQEANQITSLVSESEKLVKLDSAASYKTATSPELSKYRFIHFATHGVFDAERPERSGVIFSVVNEQAELQRSLLSTPDVFKLNLSSDLVVLSACTTALGKQIKGEGLIGLTGGLMYAGSKSVVSSFWDVDDGGTAELMSIFYDKMLKENLSPAAALRAAQLSMWNSSKWQAPFYWAAFSLQGVSN